MRKRWTRIGKYRIKIFIVILCGLVVSEFYFLVAISNENKYLLEQIGTHQRYVYIASEKIAKGDVLTDKNMIKAVRYSDAAQEMFITSDELGAMVSMDVEAGMYLTKNMLLSGEENRRNVFISEVDIPDYIQEGSRVDIRIRYPNAEDYVVISDKIIGNIATGNGMVLKLTEEEILMLSSAITDKSIYSGVRLYVVCYPEYEYAEAGHVTYPARKEILLLMNREHIEGESRSALEKRLLQNRQ